MGGFCYHNEVFPGNTTMSWWWFCGISNVIPFWNNNFNNSWNHNVNSFSEEGMKLFPGHSDLKHSQSQGMIRKEKRASLDTTDEERCSTRFVLPQQQRKQTLWARTYHQGKVMLLICYTIYVRFSNYLHHIHNGDSLIPYQNPSASLIFSFYEYFTLSLHP